MTKWKLEIKAPFLWAAPANNRSGVNDYFNIYWQPNQSQYALSTWYDCTNPNYLAPSPKMYDVTDAPSSDFIKAISDYSIPYSSIYTNAYALGQTSLYSITQYGITTLKTVTNMVDGQSLVHFNNNLYYFYNTSSAGDIGKFNLTDTYDDDWGSTVPTGHAALELAIHPNTVYKNNLIFGNGRYLGKYNYVNNTLTPQYIDYGAGTLVTDVAVTGSYLFVSVVFPALWTKKRSFIYKYDALLTETDPLDCVNEKLEVTALHVKNGIVYVFYGDTSFDINNKPIEAYLGYISGNQLIQLTSFPGYSPRFNQVTERYDYLAFMEPSRGQIFLYGQYDIGTNNILIPYSLAPMVSAGTAGCLASPFNGLMCSSKRTLFSPTCYLKREPISADVSGTVTGESEWCSIAQMVGDSCNDSIIQNITVYTNYFASGGGVTLYLRTPSIIKHYTINTAMQVKHVFRNIDTPADMFCIKLDWDGFSESNYCVIKNIIINGQTRER